MRILLFILLVFLHENTFAYNIVKYSDKIIGHSYHIINDSEFNVYKKHIQKILPKKLSPRHTILIKEIIITDSYVDDTSEGICCYDGDSVRLVISTKSIDFDLTIFHEVSHAMKFTYYGNIWTDIEKEWKKCNRFVTEYAKTNIDEDFAEVGSYYLTGHFNPKNEKYNLFKYFIKAIG